MWVHIHAHNVVPNWQYLSYGVRPRILLRNACFGIFAFDATGNMLL